MQTLAVDHDDRAQRGGHLHRHPTGSRTDLYLTGLSTGGYMAVRAATHFGGLISAFAPVASGDPCRWVRDCTPRAGDRTNVFGVGLDAETRRNISEVGACAEPSASAAALKAKPLASPPGAITHLAQARLTQMGFVSIDDPRPTEKIEAWLSPCRP